MGRTILTMVLIAPWQLCGGISCLDKSAADPSSPLSIHYLSHGLLVFDHVSRYRRDTLVVVPSRESPPLPIGPGIPMQVVVPSVSRAAVLQGTALTTLVEIPSGPTLSKPGPGYTSGTEPPNGLFGASDP